MGKQCNTTMLGCNVLSKYIFALSYFRLPFMHSLQIGVEASFQRDGQPYVVYISSVPSQLKEHTEYFRDLP